MRCFDSVWKSVNRGSDFRESLPLEQVIDPVRPWTYMVFHSGRPQDTGGRLLISRWGFEP